MKTNPVAWLKFRTVTWSIQINIDQQQTEMYKKMYKLYGRAIQKIKPEFNLSTTITMNTFSEQERSQIAQAYMWFFKQQ
jgi:hypothetical protein